MKNLNEFNINDLKFNSGNIKVDIQDLIFFLKIFMDYFSAINNEKQEEKFVTYFLNKYIALTELRAEEQRWYNILKSINENKFKDLPPDQRESYVKQVTKFYKNTKLDREKLAIELENVHNFLEL